MLFKSPVFSQASGSIAGITYSRNKGGMYTRARAVPTNPNTARQQAVKNVFSNLATAWSAVLTQAQRDAWSLYGENTPVTNRLGDEILLSGFNHYIRSNTPRVQAGMIRIDDGPTTFGLPEFTEPSVGDVDSGSQSIDLNFEATDSWVDSPGAALLVYMGRPVSETINFFKGPYRFSNAILGDDTTPPDSPEELTVQYPFAAGQRINFRANVTFADGRLGSAVRFGKIAEA